MNQDDLTNLRRLYKEATQGEWEQCGCEISAWLSEEEQDALAEDRGYHAPAMQIYDEGGHTEVDAELICAMHKHLPYLLEAAQMKMEFDELEIKEGKIEDLFPKDS